MQKHTIIDDLHDDFVYVNDPIIAFHRRHFKRCARVADGLICTSRSKMLFIIHMYAMYNIRRRRHAATWHRRYIYHKRCSPSILYEDFQDVLARSIHAQRAVG